MNCKCIDCYDNNKLETKNLIFYLPRVCKWRFKNMVILFIDDDGKDGEGDDDDDDGDDDDGDNEYDYCYSY